MKHEYTRQRQGRDFSIEGYLRNADIDTECGRKNKNGTLGSDIPNDDTENNKSLLAKLEQCREDTERNAVPIDGHELPERERSLI